MNATTQNHSQALNIATRTLIAGLLLGLIATAAEPAKGAAIISLDPDLVPTGTSLNDFFPGVRMAASGKNVNNPNVYSLTSSFASTGSKVFGFQGSFETYWMPGYADLRVDFDNGATEVWIDAIGNDSSDYATLKAFDFQDTLIDSYETAKLGTGIVETMSVSGNIAYIVASGRGGDNVNLDNLGYVPEPTTMGLLGLGGIATLIRRKRK